MKDPIYELISCWYSWLAYHKDSMNLECTVPERCKAIKNCENLMRLKHSCIKEIDEKFQCLEKKN